jgi:hypothetical protein
MRTNNFNTESAAVNRELRAMQVNQVNQVKATKKDRTNLYVYGVLVFFAAVTVLLNIFNLVA